MSQKQWMKVRTVGSDAPIHSRDFSCEDNGCRPVVVIDPEDREQVERLRSLYDAQCHIYGDPRPARDLDPLADALREFANPTPPRPEEPTDPKALVTDRRDNVWRLLADGEWVCTSGPDIGEYLAWDRLASERGPVEVTS